MLGIGRGGPLGGDGEAAAAAPEPSTPPPGAAVGRVLADAGHGRPDGRATAAGRASRVTLDEAQAWVVLAAVDGIGPVSVGALVRAAGGARGVLEAAATRAGVSRIAAAVAAEGVRLAPDLAATRRSSSGVSKSFGSTP